MGYEELQIENERLKKDISELEIMHRAEVECLNTKIRELEKEKIRWYSSTPIEIAQKLVDASERYGVFGVDGLTEIIAHLGIYCGFKKG